MMNESANVIGVVLCADIDIRRCFQSGQNVSIVAARNEYFDYVGRILDNIIKATKQFVPST